MDINKIFTKIKELGHTNSRRDELREYCKIKFDEIAKLLPRRILSSDGGDLLDCIFNGLSDNQTKNKVKLIDIVLQVMRKESTSLTHCGDVISRLCLELPRLPAVDLVRWCNDSVQSIIEDSDVNMIWKDILPECLSGLSAYNNVTHCGTEMTVPEFKEQCVRTLCQCRWKDNQLVQLTAMFKDMQMPRNDHKQVVNKICSYVIDIPPESLPPLIHQLLKLCKSYHVDVVLSHLSHYFSVRVYTKLEPPPPDSDTMDIDDIVQHSPAELSRCLSTCIYHMSSGAEPELMKQHVKSWAKTQLLRNPFIVDLALALSDKGTDFRGDCLDVIKSAIEQRLLDELRSKESSWTREVMRPDVDVASVLKVLTTESSNHRELTVLGLISLAFVLLSVHRSRPAASGCWSLGKLILARLSKSQPETTPHILTQLCDKLVQDNTLRQYTDCLHVLCALTPVSVERCTQLTTILENCQPVPGDYKMAAAVLDSVHPLINFSTRVRDALVMVCRKGLYSRDSMYRCLALSGFLVVLRHVKVARTLASSDSSCSEQYSAHSYLTQLTVDVHASHSGAQVTSRVRNEAMCMEVVSILRRCLVQDAAVKELLFTKIYECAKDKPVLHEAVLELLYEHMSKYLPDSDGDGPPILFDKCVQVTPVTALLTEPISRLIYSIGQFLQPEEEDLEDILASQSLETGSAYLRSKLTSVLDQLSRSHNIARINMDEPGLTDLTPESRAKNLKVQQVLSCYEALIAHQIMQWTNNSENVAEIIFNLFKAYNLLLEQTKGPAKLGKKSSKTNLNDTRETVKSQKTQKSQKSQKDKAKTPAKVSNLVKDRAGPFKALPCVWDLKFCLRFLELLYNETVPWCQSEPRNQARSKRELHVWATRAVGSVLAQGTDKRLARDVANIAQVLYRRVLCRFQDMCDFDDQTTLCCLELFKDCLAFLLTPQYSLKLDSFLPVITGPSETSSSARVAGILDKIHAAFQLIDEESVAEERDALVKKMLTVLTQIAALLLEVHVPCTAETRQIVNKLEEYVRSSKQDCLSLIPPLLTAGHREHTDAHFLDDLLRKLTSALGIIDEESTEEEPTIFPSIDSRSGHTVLNYICSHLSTRHRCIEHLLHRARDLSNALTTAVPSNHQRIDKELKDLYKSIISQLSQLALWTGLVCKLRCSVGGGSDRVLACAVSLYSLLGTLANHIDDDNAQLARFDRLLKISGKKFSAITDNLITYLEASQEQPRANKVLRDTKLIPRLVLKAELFSKNVIVLARKSKVNYQQYLSLGTARDFRIKGPVLQEVLQARREEPRNEGNVDINDAETEVLSPRSENGDIEEIVSDEEDTTTNKRRRIS